MLKLSDPDLAKLRLKCMHVATRMTPLSVGETGSRYIALDNAERIAESLYAFALNPPDAPAQEG